MKVNFGLIGYPLDHSFSPKYFEEKFRTEGLTPCCYQTYPLSSIETLPELINSNHELYGLNVTIPYKEKVLSYLDTLETRAKEAGAVNTVTIDRSGDKPYLTGYNTDIPAFRETIETISDQYKKALVLGSGGASKAVVKALEEAGKDHLVVSRKTENDSLTYRDITASLLDEYKLIIQCTPLGMAGMESEMPPLPYKHIGGEHFLYDLVYNPAQTKFLEEGRKRGARTKNGYEMLKLQADKSWEIWQNVIPSGFHL